MIINNRLVNNHYAGISVGGYGHDRVHISIANIFASNYIAGNAWDQTPTPWGPAPTAQVNPWHGGAGVVSLNFWTANVIESSSSGGHAEGADGPSAWDLSRVNQYGNNATALTIFEPG